MANDDRTIDRSKYGQKPLSETELRLITEVKHRAGLLDDSLQDAGNYTPVDRRAMDIAREKVEEAVMWATKAISK